MNNKFFLIFTICMFSNFSSQAAVAALEELEEKRTRVEFTDSRKFERFSQESAALLPQTLKENQTLSLFSLLRTRHHFFGMPNMVSALCGPRNEELALVDALAVHVWHDEELEDFWRQGTEESCYDSKILEALKESFKDEFGPESAEKITRDYLKGHKLLLDAAFSVYEIFAPKMSMGYALAQLSSAFYRGWTTKGLDAAHILWFNKEDERSERQDVLCRVGEDPTVPLNPIAPYGVIEGETIEVTYLFIPWMVEKKSPFTFKLVKQLSEIKTEVRPFLRLLLPTEAQKNLELEFSLLKKGYSQYPSQEAELEVYTRRISKEIIRSVMINYLQGLLLQRMEKPQEAYPHFKLAADRGLPHAQDYCGLHLQETDPSLARLYFKAGTRTDFIYANFRYGDCLKEGVGGKKDLEKALIFLKKAADSGHPYAQYDYALLRYEESLRYLKKASQQHVREAEDLLPRLPIVF